MSAVNVRPCSRLAKLKLIALQCKSQFNTDSISQRMMERRERIIFVKDNFCMKETSIFVETRPQNLPDCN